MRFSDIFLESLYKRSDDFLKINKKYNTRLDCNIVTHHIAISYSSKKQKEVTLFDSKQIIQLYEIKVETNNFSIWWIEIYFEFCSNETNIVICDIVKYLSDHFKQTNSNDKFKESIQLAMEREMCL